LVKTALGKRVIRKPGRGGAAVLSEDATEKRKRFGLWTTFGWRGLSGERKPVGGKARGNVGAGPVPKVATYEKKRGEAREAEFRFIRWGGGGGGGNRGGSKGLVKEDVLNKGVNVKDKRERKYFRIARGTPRRGLAGRVHKEGGHRRPKNEDGGRSLYWTAARQVRSSGTAAARKHKKKAQKQKKELGTNPPYLDKPALTHRRPRGGIRREGGNECLHFSGKKTTYHEIEDSKR